MNDTVLVAILSLVGTAVGSIGGILAANQLTKFRLQELEKKVDKHNGLVERMVEVEQRSKSNTRRIDALEAKTEHILMEVKE